MSTANTLGRLALKHARNAVAESMYLKGLGDVTRPTTVYGIVNERCNYKCRYCEFWRMKEYQDEMSIDQWKEPRLVQQRRQQAGQLALAAEQGHARRSSQVTSPSPLRYMDSATAFRACFMASRPKVLAVLILPSGES